MAEDLQLIAHADNKSILLTPELETTLPVIEHAFDDVDAAFNEDRRAYLQTLERSQFTVKTDRGPEVACSLLMNDSKQAEELMIIFAPLADRDPKSSADTLYRYISRDPSVSRTAAKPNTWNQTTKSAVTADLLTAFDRGMPVLTIYGPVPTHAHSAAERKLFRRGDFTPFGTLAMEAIRGAITQAQLQVHSMDSPQQFHKLHISGASLGANNAVGAAAKLMEQGFDVQTVTAQELVLSPRSLPDLAKRFTAGGLVGGESHESFPEISRVIGEASLRQAIDYKGSEPIGVNLRMVQSASKYSYMRGMTRPQPTVEAIERLLERDVDVLVATADNSAMSDKGRTLLPEGVQQIHITAQEGAKLGHIVDEHVALSALVIALNVMRTR